MRAILRALFALLSICLFALLCSCKATKQTLLSVEILDKKTELLIQSGDMLPYLETPEADGWTFYRWEQNEKPFDIEAKLFDFTNIKAKFIEETKGSEDLIFAPLADGTSLTVVCRKDLQQQVLIIPSFTVYNGRLLPVVEIADGAFRGADIKELVLSKNLTRIGEEAFFGATLPHLFLPSGLTQIDEMAFCETSGFNLLDLPVKIESVAENAFARNTIVEFRTNPSAKQVVAKDGVLYIQNTLLSFPGNFVGKEVKIAEGTVAIAAHSFENAFLSHVELPTTVKQIGQAAFRNARIKTINVRYIESVGKESFLNAVIDELNFTERLTTVEDYAFDALYARRIIINANPHCTRPGTPIGIVYADEKWLEGVCKMFPTAKVADKRLLNGFAPIVINGMLVDVPDGLTKVIVPKNVKKIAQKALYHKNLKTVTFQCYPPEAEGTMFWYSDDLRIEVPKSKLLEYQTMFSLYIDLIVPYSTDVSPPGGLEVKLQSDGIKDEIQFVEDGSVFTLPLKEKVGYNFLYWEENEVRYPAGYRITVFENRTLTAVFQIKTFTVSFYANGQLLKTDTVQYGAQADAPSGVPTKPPDDQFVYELIGWDKTFDFVTANLVVNAIYKQIPKLFSVSFYALGVLLKTDTVQYGAQADAPSGVPTKPPNSECDYEFLGWDITFDFVTANLVVNAIYKQIPKLFSVSFYALGVLLKTDMVQYGAQADAPSGVPIKPPDDQFIYKFIGWDIMFDFVISNITVTAVYQEVEKVFVVIFYSNNHVLEARNVKYGMMLGELPDTKREGFVFDGYYDFYGILYTHNSVILSNTILIARFTILFDPYAFTDGLEFSFDYEANAYFVEFYFGEATDVVIPSRYDGENGDHKVIRLGRFIFENKYLTSVSIPEGIQEIEDGAFAFVNGLIEIVLPKSLMKLGDNVFYGAEDLKVIFLGKDPEHLLKNVIVTLFANKFIKNNLF